MLRQALSLCSSLAQKKERLAAAFFEAVRVCWYALSNQGGKKLSLPELNARVNELMKQAVKSEGVINLFSDIQEGPSLILIEKISAVLQVDEAEIMFGNKAEEEEVKDLMNKIFSMDKKKRRAVERMIDVISDL